MKGNCIALGGGAIAQYHRAHNKLCAWRHDMPRPSPPRVGASGGSGVFIFGATGVATLSSGGTQLILIRPELPGM